MRSAIIQLHSSGVDLRILSDANTFFISSFLKSQGISHCFSRVVSNPATWTSGVLRVQPYTPWGQSPACGFSCPENLCKVTATALQMAPRVVCVCVSAPTFFAKASGTQGSVVSEWMKERDWARVCYVGDGSGDICGRFAALVCFDSSA
jgi:hypothetical protein